MKRITAFLLFVLPFAGQAQTYEMQNYEWQSDYSIHQVTTAEKAEPVVVLLDKKVVEYAFNKSDQLEKYVTRHRIIHLNEDKAVEDFNKIYIPVQSADQLLNFKARSVNKDGKMKEMLKGEMKAVTDKGQRYMSLAVDGLEKGSELEYYYTLSGGSSYYGSEFLQSGLLIRKCELTLISPENIILAAKSYNGFPQLKDTVYDKKHHLTGKMEGIQPLNDEKYSIHDANLMRVEYKLSQNLKRSETLLLTYADGGNLFYGRLTELKKNEVKDVEKLAAKLKLNNKSDEEKVRAIESYIKTNINTQEGVNVSDLSEVIKSGISSTFGVQRLALALVKQANVKCEIVVTISRYTKRFDPDFESWNYLDDVVLYFPSFDKYMVPENALYRLGLLPMQYSGSSALFIKELDLGGTTSGISSVRKLPEPDATISHDNMDISVQFNPTMTQVTQHTKRFMKGYAAIGVRPLYYYSPEDKKKESIEEIMKTSIEGVKVSNLKVFNYDLNTDESEKDFIAEADLSYSSLLEKADNTVLFKVGAVIGPQEEMYQEKPRQGAMDIDFAHNLDRTISITVPDGYVAKGLDAININITGGGSDPTMGFVSSYTLNGNKLEIKIHEFYNKLNYPSAQYEQFRKVINASADFNKVTIVFEKKS